VRSVRYQLDHEDDDEAVIRIDTIPGAVRAAPPVRADLTHAGSAEALDRLECEAPAEAVDVVEGAGLVRRQQLHRARCENPHTVELASVADHLEKACVIVRGRHQTGAAGEAAAR